MTVYKNPLYYEIAFSFINPKKQINLFEKFIKRYSKIKVKCFLDLGCGPSLQLREIAKKGYQAIGLDSSPHMLKYLKDKANDEKIRIETVKAKLTNFKLKRKADFAFIMIGTISYIKNNEEFLNHLDSVANSLNKGGLYLIENFRLDWENIISYKPQIWTMKRGDIKVKTTYSIQIKDTINQLLNENMKLEVNDSGKKKIFREVVDTKMIFPQEFLELVKLNNKFQFIGWFEHNKVKPLKKANNENNIVLRRK